MARIFFILVILTASSCIRNPFSKPQAAAEDQGARSYKRADSPAAANLTDPTEPDAADVSALKSAEESYVDDWVELDACNCQACQALADTVSATPGPTPEGSPSGCSCQ